MFCNFCLFYLSHEGLTASDEANLVRTAEGGGLFNCYGSVCHYTCINPSTQKYPLFHI